MQQNLLGGIHFLLVVIGFGGMCIKWDRALCDDLYKYIWSSDTHSHLMYTCQNSQLSKKKIQLNEYCSNWSQIFFHN